MRPTTPGWSTAARALESFPATSSWTERAEGFAHELLRLFGDDKSGLLFTTGSDADPLVVRPRDAHDGVTPSAGSVAAVALARLGAVLADAGLQQASEQILRASRPPSSRWLPLG